MSWDANYFYLCIYRRFGLSAIMRKQGCLERAPSVGEEPALTDTLCECIPLSQSVHYRTLDPSFPVSESDFRTVLHLTYPRDGRTKSAFYHISKNSNMADSIANTDTRVALTPVQDITVHEDLKRDLCLTVAEEEASSQPWKAGQREWLIVFCLCIINACVALDATVVVPPLPVSTHHRTNRHWT